MCIVRVQGNGAQRTQSESLIECLESAGPVDNQKLIKITQFSAPVRQNKDRNRDDDQGNRIKLHEYQQVHDQHN